MPFSSGSDTPYRIETSTKFWPSAAFASTIGALPGTGGDIAAHMDYDHAKREIKDPEGAFGEGAMQSLVAPETAQSAAVGGAFIPMMTLGIPGDAVTAIMIGALFIHGPIPGPMLTIYKPDMLWFIVGCLVMANYFMLLLGLGVVGHLMRHYGYPPGPVILGVILSRLLNRKERV